MKKIKTTCHICDNVMKSEEAPAACAKCGANLADPQEETVQKQVHCQYTTSAVGGWTGWLYLTNKRLLWIKDNAAAAVSTGTGGLLGGLLGGLADIAAGGGKVGFSIPLEDILSVEKSKIGLLAKAVAITLKDGTQGKLGISKQDEWVAALLNATASVKA